MAKIFIIGGTGFFGGALLDTLLKQHAVPELDVKVLVRGDDKAARLKSKYPSVKIVVGDLNSFAILEDESRNADIVINAAPDITYDKSIQTILKGLEGHGRESFYIHTSGAATFFTPVPSGKLEGKIWDDVKDIDEILSQAPGLTHVNTDNIVRSAAPAVNVAILAPPGIAGISPSIEHPYPLLMGAWIPTAKALKSGFMIADGENALTCIHVMDMARGCLLLVDNALDSLKSGKPPAEPAGFPVWGPQAYYFFDAEDIPFRKLQGALAAGLVRHGALKTAEVCSYNYVELGRTILAGGGEFDPDAPLPPPDSWIIHMATSCGINMRVRGSRLRKLGWKLEEKSVLDAMDEGVALYLQAEGK